MAARAFITGLAGLDVSANERAFLREAQPWGLIIFKRNVSTPSQVQALVRSFRDILGWEAPVLVDQEGGRVQRLGPPHWVAFPPGAPQNTQYILVYLNRPDKWARRMFHQWNQGHAADGAVNFPLSTFLHTVRDGSPPEWLLVGYLNNWTEPVQAYLIVTIRECVQ